MKTGAILSEDRKYRYVLWREWDARLPKLMFIGLNPSTADENKDDPTIRRCISFAKSWGFGGFYMTNLFAYRSPSPSVLGEIENPIGDENAKYIQSYVALSEMVVAVWGNKGSFMGRSTQVRDLFDNLYCLGTNKSGEPKHPLYVNSQTKLKQYHQQK